MNHAEAARIAIITTATATRIPMLAPVLRFECGAKAGMVVVLAADVDEEDEDVVVLALEVVWTLEEVVLDDVAEDEMKEEYDRDVGVAITERDEGAGALKT
jgi:hypothetical protein